MTEQPRTLPRVLPALVLAGALASSGLAAEMDDAAGLFPPGAEAEAQQVLDRIEREQGVPVRIETVESIRSAITPEELAQWEGKNKHEALDLLARRRAETWDRPGVLVLISRQDRVMSMMVNQAVAGRLTPQRREQVRISFTDSFGRGDYADGLRAGVEQLEGVLAANPAPAGGGPAAPAGLGAPGAPAAQGPQRGGGGLPVWLVLLLLIGGGFLVIRLLSGLFGAGRGPIGAGGPMGGGPGGYGHGGGGFFSGLFGGLGGALLGNWMYDRFTGHHQSDPGSMAQDPGTIDDPNRAAGWGDSTGGDPWQGTSGDWGGDAGGGGDWSGGGGDWGGDAGGDW